MILEIDNVELWFKDKRVLQGIYLKAETGQVTGILGSNGSGKSCLMRIIFGSLQPKYKLVRIDDSPITKPLYKTHLISYLPQHHFAPKHIKLKTLFKLFQVDWIAFTNHFQGFIKYKNTTINRLSGGERRIIEIYLILKKEAKIVLLDEPFNGVAPLFIEKIKMLIVEEKHQKTIMLTDHSYAEIIDISDTIYLMKNGYSKKIEDVEDLKFHKYVSENAIL